MLVNRIEAGRYEVHVADTCSTFMIEQNWQGDWELADMRSGSDHREPELWGVFASKRAAIAALDELLWA
jgi:hypothetical protein